MIIVCKSTLITQELNGITHQLLNKNENSMPYLRSWGILCTQNTSCVHIKSKAFSIYLGFKNIH